MKARQFLKVVTETCRDGWSLSRIVNPRKQLFYPSMALAQQHQATKVGTMEEADYDDDLWLPTPSLRFKPSPRLGYCGITSFDFLPFYSGAGGGWSEERILGVDGYGKAVLYNADTGSAEIMPSLNKPKEWFPVSICATHAVSDRTRPHAAHPDALYIMDREGRSFETLVYGDPNLSPPCESMNPMDTDRCMWHWRPLPPPPIVVDNGYYGRGGGSIFAQTYVLLRGRLQQQHHHLRLVQHQIPS